MYPKLRFKGFDDAWEQRKLYELLDLLKDGTHGTHKDVECGPLLLSAKNIKQGKIIWDESDRRISRSDFNSIHAKYKLKEKDVLLTIVGSIGETAILRECKDITFQRSVAILRTNNKVLPEFLYTEIQTTAFQNELNNRKSTSAQPGIYLNDLKEIFINLPANKEEQLKIGAYFEQLDNLITLHQRQCEALKKQKQFFLQNMFPKEGESEPRIRFNGFTEPWEQRKVNSLIEEFSEKTTQNNQYPVLTSSRKGIFLQTDYFSGNQVASIDNTGYNIVPKGYFTYRHMSDDEIFYFNINDIVDRGIVSTLYPVFKAKDKVADSYFLRYVLNYGEEFRKYAILQKQGGSRTYMYLKKLKELELTIPHSFDEQVVISTFLLKIDNIITLHQRQYEQLVSLKKYLLSKMFI